MKKFFKSWLLIFTGVICPVVGISAEDSFTIMAANTTSGNLQSYDLEHGIRIFQGLKPDIALAQEFNYKNNSYSDLEEFKTIAFGIDYMQCVPVPGNQIPNGIVSRYPIVKCGSWNDSNIPNRDFIY